MGALLISKNDLSALEPSLALRVEEAIARALAPFPATFRATIERLHDGVRLCLEEHRGAQPHPIRELRIDPRWSSDEIRRRIEGTLGARDEDPHRLPLPARQSRIA